MTDQNEKSEKEIEETEVEVLSDLIENAGIFESRGFSNIKLTVNGQETQKRIPIRSHGVVEYQEILGEVKPNPPVIEQVVKKDSALGMELGLKEDSPVMMHDVSDNAFNEAIKEYHREVTWKTVVHAITCNLKKADGSIAETYEEKKAVLVSNRITGHQLNKIFNDIMNLTRFQEERQDFLSGSGSD